MENNDILRRIRYVFDFGDDKMIELFSHVKVEVTRAQVSDWLKKDDDPEQQVCRDVDLANFLNGLIIERRGRREGAMPDPETRLTNNLILKKLKIALDYKSSDIVAIMKHADYKVSETELSAFFRKPGHKHYRDCMDQMLRRFLQGLQIEHRGA